MGKVGSGKTSLLCAMLGMILGHGRGRGPGVRGRERPAVLIGPSVRNLVGEPMHLQDHAGLRCEGMVNGTSDNGPKWAGKSPGAATGTEPGIDRWLFAPSHIGAGGVPSVPQNRRTESSTGGHERTWRCQGQMGRCGMAVWMGCHGPRQKRHGPCLPLRPSQAGRCVGHVSFGCPFKSSAAATIQGLGLRWSVRTAPRTARDSPGSEYSAAILTSVRLRDSGLRFRVENSRCWTRLPTTA